MGNLTDIGHGLGKYLEISDGDTLPGIEQNRNSIKLLQFKVATNNNYVMNQLVDGVIDAYQDASGVDAGASTNETRDGSGEFYWGNGSNLTLQSTATTAKAQPTQGRIIIFEEAATGTTTINTDIIAAVSRDGGSTFTAITLSNDGLYATAKRILSGSVDISGQPSGTSMKYKITTHNQSGSKATRIHGASLLWA